MTAVMERSGVMEPAICGAARRQGGEPCHKPAGWGTDHLGYGRCRLHGGSTQSHRTHHLRLVESLVPGAIGELQRLVSDPDVPDAVKLRTAQDILDRAGIGAKLPDVSVTVNVSVEERQAALIERAKALREGRVIDTTVSEDGDPR